VRYLETVTSVDDDFQELSDLLFRAKERYRSARATITHTVVGSVAEESKRRFVNWRFAQPGGSGLGILRTEEERRAHGPDMPQACLRPKTSEGALSSARGSARLDLGKLLFPLPLARRTAPPDEADPQDQEPCRQHDPANVGEVDHAVGLRRLGGENREEEG
jgi:hypothetical protein